MSRIVRRLLLLLVALPLAVGAQSPAAIRDLDAYIQKTLADWDGAGLAIAVVKDDSVVFANGYGVREVGKPDAVTPRTLFAIGSNTKLFTAVVAGIAVDEGKLNWGDRVTTYLPWFQLYDPFASREITVRDMLSHNSGLGRRGDQLWYGTVYNRQEILRRVRYLPPSASFRAEFGYSNIMVLGAGEATAAAMGASWDELIRTRIFVPLGMTSSNTSVRDLKAGQDIATPHTWRAGHAVPVPYRNIDNIGPAGAINSNVLDMAKWLRMLLANGKFQGRQIVSAASLHEIEAPHTIISTAPDSLSHFSAYGLGIGMGDYRGVKVLSHSGGIDGMLSAFTIIPERGLGVVVLTNTDGHNVAFAAAASRAIDTFMGWPLRDASTPALAQARRAEAKHAADARALDSARVKGTSPLPLDHYAGVYSSDMYGDVTVTVANSGLMLLSSWNPSLRGPLSHWHYNVFRTGGLAADSGIDSKSFVRFEADEHAKVPALTLEMQEGDVVFHRKPAAKRSDGN